MSAELNIEAERVAFEDAYITQYARERSKPLNDAERAYLFRLGSGGMRYDSLLVEGAWDGWLLARRAPLPAEQPSNPVPLMSRKVELELLAVAEACVAQGCIVAMEDWIEARIVGQQTKGGAS